MKVQDAESLDLKVALYSDFYINNALFQLVFLNSPKGTAISGQWINRDFIFKMQEVAEYFGVEFPDCLDFELFIETIRLRYATVNQLIDFNAVIRDFGSLTLSTKLIGTNRNYSFDMAFNQKLELSSLPIVGQFCDDGDGFLFKKIDLAYTANVEFVFSIVSELRIKKIPLDLSVDYRQSLKKQVKSLGLNAEQPKNTIYWLKIDKGFSVLYFSQIGVSLNGSDLKLYLDASFTIARLRVDFYELYVSTSLKKLTDIGFGLGGLMVNVETKAFSLIGGLYKSQEEECLYNGLLGLTLSKYSFMALGSYGQLPGSGEMSFFAYLMIGAPMGGPPYFFVTGLALGFGINRTLKLPNLDGVRTFPLVAAAMGDSGALKPDTPPKAALSALSKSIVPIKGQYFFSAGIRFTSFGVLETFLLLNVELGNNVVISLLGLADASLPPKVSGLNPIARAELAIKAVIDIGAGEIIIMAALTDRSFLFHPSCKLTGGFALGFWFGGAYKGDFIVTIGGCHHPQFVNKHYPDIPALGVTWILNKNISVKGEAYFALTPTCMMAGGQLKLLFELGNLKAWFFAAAEFLMQWKPFFYSARVQVSIGVSYRISIFGIGKTFKVEMGAGLSLWGPDFSCEVYIDWYILSFTIGYNNKNDRKPKPIEWGEFAESFIPESTQKSKAASQIPLPIKGGEKRKKAAAESASLGTVLSKTSVSGGLLGEYKTSLGEPAYIVDGYNAAFAVDQKTPCSKLYYNGSLVFEFGKSFGIVPMAVSSVSIEQKVSVYKKGQTTKTAKLFATPSLKNVPSALWGNTDPGINGELLTDAPMGMQLNAANFVEVLHIIPSQGAYKESVLSQRESITKEIRYIRPNFIDPKHYDEEEDVVMETIQKTIIDNERRNNIIEETSFNFGTWNFARFKQIGDNPRVVFFTAPKLRTEGSLEMQVIRQ